MPSWRACSRGRRSRRGLPLLELQSRARQQALAPGRTERVCLIEDDESIGDAPLAAQERHQLQHVSERDDATAASSCGFAPVEKSSPSAAVKRLG